MQAVSYSGTGWRVFLTNLLKKYNIRVQDPVKTEREKTGMSASRTKAYLKTLAALILQGDNDAERKFKKLMRRIVRNDFKMVNRSDFIIAQVIEGVVSIGTTAEIIHASEKKIPVYVIYSGRPHYFSHWLLDYIVRSGGKVFREKNKNCFKKCLDYLRNKFELEELELERNGVKNKRRKRRMKGRR